MKRFETRLGDDGIEVDIHGSISYGRMIPYISAYMFLGKPWHITVWARSEREAKLHCANFGLIYKGEMK